MSLTSNLISTYINRFFFLLKYSYNFKSNNKKDHIVQRIKLEVIDIYNYMFVDLSYLY